MTRRRWAVGAAVLTLTALAAFGQPAAADPDEDEYPADDWADDAGTVDTVDLVQAPAARTRPASAPRRPSDDLTDEQAGAIGIASLCCCGLVVAGLVALIVWAVRRSSRPAPGAAPAAGHAPPPTAAPVGMQLSIFALGLEPQARDVVEQQLAQQGISSVPTSPETRGRLVREAARALLTVQPSWRQFGYGEKPGLSDLAAAETSYRAASDDFRGRAASVGAAASVDAGLGVVTLLICSRRPLLGVSRLDDPLQVRTLLEDRMRVGDLDLLGAELLWSPAAGGRVSEAEIALRFPEMQPLAGRSI